MGISTMIIGQSGRGKSTSIENLNPEGTIVIKAINKPFPFRSHNWKKWTKEDGGSYMVTDDYNTIMAVIRGAKSKGKKVIVIDDVKYLMSGQFMRRLNEKGFDKFSEIGAHMYNLVRTANEETDDDVRIYFLSHEEENDNGNVKAKTIGKLLDDKITLEGLFTIVLRAMKVDKRYFFATQNNGRDTAKSPKGMFEEEEVANDLALVDKAICEYYGIK